MFGLRSICSISIHRTRIRFVAEKDGACRLSLCIRQAPLLYAAPRFRQSSTKAEDSKLALSQDDYPQDKRPQWQTQKRALKSKFGDTGWQPRKRLSPDAIEGIRTLHMQDPQLYSTPYLADYFKVSPEAIRRILKSKWRPSEKEAENRQQRWAKRGQSVWSRWAELGFKPPKKWRNSLVEDSREKSVGDGPGSPELKSQRERHVANTSLSSRIL